MLVIGVDGATWDVINENIDELSNFQRMMKEGRKSTITLEQKPWSPSVWCSMFCGKTPEEHGHHDFVKDGNIVSRRDIKVDFIWDMLNREGISVKALNVPFIVPPYNYNISFAPIAGGVPVEVEELLEEIESVTQKALDVLKNEKPTVFIVVYTALDKLSHLHWGEPIMLEYYKKVDEAIGRLIEFDEEVIIISDHGFCDYEKAPIQTLPKKTPKGEIKGDHHPDAILITKNIDFKINQPMDLFFGLKKKYLGA
ncbi:MAG: alkaline phosphatase family protein [Candidatus Hydrothermarchaeaceae archaeon]